MLETTDSSKSHNRWNHSSIITTPRIHTLSSQYIEYFYQAFKRFIQLMHRLIAHVYNVYFYFRVVMC